MRKKGNSSVATDIATAAHILRKSSYVIAFTGAGISTESGIPDFRSPGGLWEKYDPSIYADYNNFLKHPGYFWNLAIGIFDTLVRARPNRAHKALVTLERMGKLKVIITQNIDRLHQKAGSMVPILELHGAYEEFNCINCGKQYSLYEYIAPRLAAGERVLQCIDCKGYIKPTAVMFGESLPMEVFNETESHLQQCDCMLVIGSSLQVYPANTIPLSVKQRGARLIVINQDYTYLDEKADVVLYGRAGILLPSLVELI